MDCIKVDGRGLSCPQPVIEVMNAMKKQADCYEILVDNQTAVENISRFLSNTGKTFTVSQADEDFLIEVP